MKIHPVEVVAIVGGLAAVAYFAFRSSGGVPATAVTGGPKPVAGIDSTMSGIDKSQPITGASMGMPAPTPSVASPGPDANGYEWVNGVDATGKSLGMVEIDSKGNYLTSASKGPATSTRSGRGHF